MKAPGGAAAHRQHPGGQLRADGTSGPTRPVAVRLTAAELAAIDAARGEETRSDYIRRHALDGANKRARKRSAARDGAPIPGDGGSP